MEGPFVTAGGMSLPAITHPQSPSGEGQMRIHVIMTTFNGALYREDRIASVLRQTVSARLFVRHDGSTDHTPYLLQKFSRVGHLQWAQGPNVGVADSFLHLLATCSNGADYVAFSDQDDVWFPDKLARAVRRL